jgi:hypothetical protein
MEIASFNIVEIFKKLTYTDLNREEINFLIDKSYRISISFLKTKFKTNLHFLRDDNHTLEDIAMDSIVPLFVNNSSGKLGLARALQKWDDNLDTEDSAEYFLSRIVWRRVDQTVTSILRERDPIFAKILKTLNISILNNRFKKYRYFGTVLVLQNKDAKIFGEIIDEKNFSNIPEKIFVLKQAALFNKLFEHIVDQTNYYPAIPLNLMVKRIKTYYTSNNDITSHYVENSEEKISIREIIDSGMLDLREKIDVYYISHNKLNSDDGDFIYAAFKNISKDMMNGGIKDSLYSYLKDYKKDLTRQIFYTEYHHIMNYLLSRLKNNISDKIYI